MEENKQNNSIWVIKKNSIQHQTLYEQISDSLEQLIIQNGNDLVKLPTEYELAKQYGVSRTVIREALKLLKERGLVSMHVGDGSYTVRPGSAVISQTLERVIRFNRFSDNDITEVRKALEINAAGKAALLATSKEIEEIESVENLMEYNKNDIEKRVEYDCLFHGKIAYASGNKLLCALVDSLMDLIKEYIRIRLEQSPAGNELGIMWHRKLIQSIKAHDENHACLYMRQHIDDSLHQLDS